MNRMGSYLKEFIGSKQLRVDNFSQIFADESQSSAEGFKTLRNTASTSVKLSEKENRRDLNNYKSKREKYA